MQSGKDDSMDDENIKVEIDENEIENQLKKLEELAKTSMKAIEKAASGISDAFGIMGDAGGVQLNQISTGFNKIISTSKGVNKTIDNVTAGIKKMPEAFEKVITKASGIWAVFSNFGEAVTLPLGDAASAVGTAFGKIGQAVSGSINRLWIRFSDFANKIVGTLSPVAGVIGSKLSAVGTVISGYFNRLMGPVTDFVNKIVGTLSPVVSSIGSKLAAAGAKMEAPFSKLAGKVITKLGSLGTYLQAWGGIVAEAFKPVFDILIGFLPTFLKCMNVAGVLGIVVAGLGLLQIAFGEQIGELLTMMQTKGPELITNLCNGIITALPVLMEQGAILLSTLLQAITANLPALLAGGVGIISGLISGIASQLPLLMPAAMGMILTLVQGLIENLPQLVNSGLLLLTGFAQGLVASIPGIIAVIPEVIAGLVTAFMESIPQLLETGIQLLAALATGLVTAIPELLGKIPEVISAVMNAFREVDWGKIGRDIIDGIAKGLTSVARNLAKAASDAAENALNWVKEKLGIHSPSKVFQNEVGRMMALGMGIGFKKNIPVLSMSGEIERAVGKLQKEASFAVRAGGNIALDSSYRQHDLQTAAGFDYDEFERRYRKVAHETAGRPIYLNGRQINRAVKSEELVLV